MAKNNFIDRNLIGLKGKINTEKNNNEKNIKPESNNKTDKKMIETVLDDKKVEKLNKEYYKALVKRKDDYFRTKDLVVTTLSNTLGKITLRIDFLNKQIDELSSLDEKLVKSLNGIEQIDEKAWDKNEFAIELNDAVQKVERARLGHMVIDTKLDPLIGEIKKKEEKEFSNYELNSLTGWQIFRLGFNFFMPLSIGLIIAALIISFSMFIAMGVL
ncbi:MAG TPA: hypothetical protein QF753_14655 [Victivallales bacterium]|nr:hypothetical protein [Victivallales bacterium]